LIASLARWAAALALLCAVAGCGASASGQATAPARGPRLTFFELEVPKKGTKVKPIEQVRLVSADPEGGDRRELVDEAKLRATPLHFSWSADGARFAYLGAGGLAYVANSDGTDAHAIAGTAGTQVAVLSADGTQLAFTRKTGQSTDTWIAPVGGGKPRKLTASARYRSSVPSSFSADGKTLLVSFQQTHGAPRVEAVDVASGKATTLASEAIEGVYSPDGSKIALVSYRDHESVPDIDGPVGTSEIYVADADGSHLHRVTHSAKKEETEPTWDPSGNRLAFLRYRGGTLGFLFSEVVEANADGSCGHVVAKLEPRQEGAEGAVYAPAWWPGPGRGAAPLSC
jgi:Tol biopolymer transport system component